MRTPESSTNATIPTSMNMGAKFMGERMGLRGANRIPNGCPCAAEQESLYPDSNSRGKPRVNQMRDATGGTVPGRINQEGTPLSLPKGP